MAKTPEAVLTAKIVKHLHSRWPEKVKAQKIHGSAMGSPTLDLIVSAFGALVWLEVKRPGQKPTPRQEATMASWRAVGATAEVVTSPEEAEDVCARAAGNLGLFPGCVGERVVTAPASAGTVAPQSANVVCPCRRH